MRGLLPSFISLCLALSLISCRTTRGVDDVELYCFAEPRPLVVEIHPSGRFVVDIYGGQMIEEDHGAWRWQLSDLLLVPVDDEGIWWSTPGGAANVKISFESGGKVKATAFNSNKATSVIWGTPCPKDWKQTFKQK